MNLRLLAIVLVLAGLAGLTVWLQENSEAPAAGRESGQANAAHTPDYFMEDFTITTMNDKGKRGSVLVSKKMLHFPDDDSTELVQPFITMYGEIGKPWTIKAERGWVSANNELVLLSGKIVIDRVSGPNNRPVTIHTDRLRIHPKTDFAETDRPVTMVSEKRRTSAVGMRAYVREGQVQLLDNVRVSYEK